MRPIPVPAAIREAPWVEGTSVFAAPDGDLTSEQIPPAEGLFYSNEVEGFDHQVFPFVAVILELDDQEVESIKNGTRHIMMSWTGRRMPVFIVPSLIEWEGSHRA